MRTFMKVEIPVEAGNRAIADGTLPKTFQEAFARIRPEAAYFTTTHGRRCAYIFLDLQDVSDMPVLAEPLFTHLDAAIEWYPCMNQDDLTAGLAKLA